MQMKEARAEVDGRDFEKMVSVEEEEGFLAREEEFFPRGRPRMREAKMLRLLRNLLCCRATRNTRMNARIRLAFKRV